jgi:hypothetical protein
VAFSTYAVPAIRHHLWRRVAQAQRPQGRPELAAQAWQRPVVGAALQAWLAGLPERSYHLIVAT